MKYQNHIARLWTKKLWKFYCASAVVLEFGLTLRNDVFGVKCVFRKKFKGANFWPFYKVEVTTNIAEKIIQVLDIPINHMALTNAKRLLNIDQSDNFDTTISQVFW